MKKNNFILSLLVLLSISQICALNLDDNQTISNMGHAIRIYDINVTPSEIPPGKSALIGIGIKNNAGLQLDDLRVKLSLPSQLKFSDDVNQVKISRLESLESKEIYFNIIAPAGTAEGIYEASLTIDYVSYLGVNYANVGEDKQDNYTFGIIVKGTPNIFAQIDNSGIYKGNYIESFTIRFFNNGIGDAKFLTIELLDSEDYNIISSNKEYIGDLDSNDFESVDFRIEVKNKKNPALLLKIDYKDSLNEDYSQEFKLPLEIRSAKELGIDTNGTTTTIVVIIIVAVIGYFVYKRYKKKKKIITR